MYPISYTFHQLYLRIFSAHDFNCIACRAVRAKIIIAPNSFEIVTMPFWKRGRMTEEDHPTQVLENERRHFKNTVKTKTLLKYVQQEVTNTSTSQRKELSHPASLVYHWPNATKYILKGQNPTQYKVYALFS